MSTLARLYRMSTVMLAVSFFFCGFAFGELVSQLSAGDAQLVLEHVRAELEIELPALAPPEPQRITRTSLRRSEARPH